MRHTRGKPVSRALAVLGLVATFAGCSGWPFQSSSAETQAQYPPSQTQYRAQTLTCTQVDTRGNCIRGRGVDDRVVVLFGENIRAGERMSCGTTDGATMRCVRVAAQ